MRFACLVHAGLLSVMLTAAIAHAQPTPPAPPPPTPSTDVPPQPPCPPCPTCPECPKCPACPPPAPPGLDADLSLLGLLTSLTAKDPAARAQAARALGRLADPRAVQPLLHTLRHDDSTTARAAAAEGLGGHRGPEVEAALEVVLASYGSSAAERRGAAHSLGKQRTQSAASALWKHRADPTTERGKLVRAVLQAHYPDALARWEKEQPSLDQGGRITLIPVLALHGGFFMTALAEIADGDPGALSFLGGAAVGGVTPYLLTIRSEMSRASALWIDSTITWGLATGGFAAAAFEVDKSETALLSMIGGQAAGLSAGLLTYDSIEYSEGDVLYLDSAGLAGGLAALGGLIAGDVDDAGTVGPWMQVGMTAGLVGGALLTDELKLSKGDAATLAFSAGAGAWTGAWFPFLLFDNDSEDQHHAGGFHLGAAAGFAAGTLASQLLEPSVDDVVETGAGAGFGSAIGGGAALMLSQDRGSSRTFAGMLLGGGGAGLVGAALSADETSFGPGDRLTVGVGTAWGLWQGWAIGDLVFKCELLREELGEALEEDEFQERCSRRDTKVLGTALFGLGLGGVTGALVAQRIEPTVMEVAMASSGGVWGGWILGWGMHVLGKRDSSIDSDDILLATLVGSDAGLALTTIALSPILRLQPERLGWINAGGLLGMGLGTSIAAVFTSDVAEGNVLGSLAGLTIGAIATSFVDFEGPGKPGSAGSSGGTFDLDVHAWWPALHVRPDGHGGTATLLTLNVIP